MKRPNYFFIMLLGIPCFSYLSARVPGGLCLDMYEHSFAATIRIINGQRSLPSDLKLLGRKAHLLKRVLGREPRSLIGDAVRYKYGMVDSIMRVHLDLSKKPQEYSHQQLRDMADKCTKNLSKLIVQPRLRMLFLRDVGKMSSGVFRLDCHECLERHVNFLLTIFYEATGYAISPFVLAYQELDDPIDTIDADTAMVFPLENYQWSFKGATSYMPFEHPSESFVHCRLLQPSLADKLSFLSRAIPYMQDRYSKLQKQVLKLSTIAATGSDVRFIRQMLPHFQTTLKQPAARRRFELYSSLMLDHLSVHNAPFILRCLALCLCIEVHCFLYNSSPAWDEKYHAMLNADAPLFFMEEALNEKGVSFDFEDELFGDFFGEDMRAKKRFVALMLHIIKQIYIVSGS